MRKFSFCFLFFCFLVFPGCMRGPRYSFPEGKTLTYVITNTAGETKKGKMVFFDPIPSLQISIKCRRDITGSNKLLITADRAMGKRLPTPNSTLGNMELYVNKMGNIIKTVGMGIPVNTRLFVPELPDRFKKNCPPWTRTFDLNPYRGMKKLDVKFEYKEDRIYAGRNCAFIHGYVSTHNNEKYTPEGTEMELPIIIDYYYQENYYIDFERGYLLKSETIEKRNSKLFAPVGNIVILDKVTEDKSEIELMGAE